MARCFCVRPRFIVSSVIVTATFLYSISVLGKDVLCYICVQINALFQHMHLHPRIWDTAINTKILSKCFKGL